MDGAPRKNQYRHKTAKDQRGKQGSTAPKGGRIVVKGKLKHKWAFK